MSFSRWYSTGIGNSNTDFWVVEISANNGANWSTLETFDTPANQWTSADFAINLFAPLTSQIRFRFTAQDTGAGSIIEAAIDDFRIFEIEPMLGTGVPHLAQIAPDLSLGTNFPNPFRAGEPTTFSLAVPTRGIVDVGVFDVAGRRVTSLHDGILEAGTHQFRWRGRVKGGSPAPAGVYFLKVTSDAGARSRKMLLLR